MENIVSTDYKNPPLEIGNNEHETATVVVDANSTLKKGSVVKRAASGKFEKATSLSAGDEGLAVIIEDVTNAASSSVDVNIRVMISGRVNRLALTVDDTALTDAQVDTLRGNSIIALPVHEV